jgi:hypothetical protein
MRSRKTQCRRPRTQVAPIVVVVGDVVLAGFRGGSQWITAYQRCLPVRVEVVPGDGDKVTTFCNTTKQNGISYRDRFGFGEGAYSTSPS